MRAIANLMDALSALLNRVALAVAVAAVAVMLGAAGWQVIARYLLSQPPAWTEELARFSMVWGGLMGASCAFRTKVDPTLFPEALVMTGNRGRLLLVVRSLGVLAFVLPTLWFCVFGPGANPARGYIARLAGRQAETMDLPMMVFGIAIPIAFAVILVHVLAELARGFAPAAGGESRR
ncbi:TRAP-type C4-dicarboxylate transport system permease small subunit [Hoeflea marina]|uniref:TRAP transporter small permease protein n=1 Tax=Hoeflea marina TaxID=274592 RepID=A0A317PIA8_9HYPH|nr:TRAP transporter small permease [Hoeflea marina]PWV97773.1 TRAP-type C4-dicarboxylate transport system permease small subunit [Hoeflea marina]